MQRYAVVATLRPGTEEEAARLIELGPPFDPDSIGLAQHTVFLAFEGGEPRTLLASLAGPEQSALGAWEPLLAGTPRIAHQVYSWVSPGHSARVGAR